MNDNAQAEPRHGEVSCRTGAGEELRGRLIKLNRSSIAFEVYGAPAALRLSEALTDLTVTLNGTAAYTGRAVVSGSMQMASLAVYEVNLENPGVYVGINMPFNGKTTFRDAYGTFFQKWQNQSRILSEFKLTVMELQSYLSELKLLLEQMEIAIAANPLRDRASLESDMFRDLAGSVLAAIDAIHERFEAISETVRPEDWGEHALLVRRHLHPLFLCSPFGYRTYHKPLGHAGDYEIMNMIHRNTFEGTSLFSKAVHYWLVNQWAAKSVRNRVTHMKTRLLEETARVVREGRTARILNLGCGPAREVQEFIAEHPLAGRADFTFLDFDEETLNFVNTTLGKLKAVHHCPAVIRTRKMSVTQLIKYMARPADSPLGSGFDFIYCGGLFDYLSNQMCQQLTSLFYEWLAPGGLVLVANMNARHRPFRHMVEFLLDWHLLYRSRDEMAAFAPEKAHPDDWRVLMEPVSVNLFLEVRKPRTG